MSDPNFSFDDLMDLFGDQGDVAHKETDKRINRVRNRLADEYKQAEKELKKKTDQYFAKFKEQDEQKRKLVQEGKLSPQEYIEWRRNKMLYGETMRQNTERMAEYLANVDQRAADIINGQLAGVYATNYNFASYTVESKSVGASFTLHDDRSVARLARDNPRLLPKVDPDKVKGQAWSRRKINNVITQGILQGKAIPDIAKGLSQVVGMEWNSAVRNARTAMTGAENAGRLGSYQDAKAMGIKLRKQWMATLDERTRESHAAIDGEIVDIDKEFSNGLMYPADPDGEPAEVYNCRCTMVADLEGVPKEPPAQTFDEWQEAKKQPLHTNNTKAYESLEKAVSNFGLTKSHRPVKQITPMSHDDTVAKLAGGDMTKGSCVSQMFAYCSNRHGVDVTDFRGGNSCDMFSRNIYIPNVFKTANSNFIEHMVDREAKDAAKIIAGLEKDKEYCLVVGRHASIIRNSSTEGLQYLELQSELHKGWMPFETDQRSVEDTLYQRFGCRKRIDKMKTYQGKDIVIQKKVWLADVDSFQMTEEFKDIMGYINTATDKQKKGVRGFAK